MRSRHNRCQRHVYDEGSFVSKRTIVGRRCCVGHDDECIGHEAYRVDTILNRMNI